MDTNISNVVQGLDLRVFYQNIWQIQPPQNPFGLEQGPAYFTALMQKVFCQFNDFCFFHMDDVLVHDASENDDLECLKLIF